MKQAIMEIPKKPFNLDEFARYNDITREKAFPRLMALIANKEVNVMRRESVNKLFTFIPLIRKK